MRFRDVMIDSEPDDKVDLRPILPKLHIVCDFFGHNNRWYFEVKTIGKEIERKIIETELTNLVKRVSIRKSRRKHMNPQGMFQIMSALNTFRQNHPKFAQFFVKYIKSGLPEGSIIEITVTRPGEEPMTTNMKVQQSDLELVQALKEINPQG